jgi:pimeloyl-ACP methyl ester carboxylesterase
VLERLQPFGTPAETTIDQARNEMTMTGMPAATVADIVALITLQYDFARTANGWDAYAAAREKLVARMGAPPETAFPSTREHPQWQVIKRTYFHDPVPTLRQLTVPTLAMWGELDNNIMADKNKPAWDTALKTDRWQSRLHPARDSKGEPRHARGEGR